MQLVLQYDGSRFAGWQRQPSLRTVQGVIETSLEQLFGAPTKVVGAGRTDAGVHARGQSAHVVGTERWDAATLKRALNALLPPDVWVEQSHDVVGAFHARYSATARRYSYYLGTDDAARSPFRRPFEWRPPRRPDLSILKAACDVLRGQHQFYGFAVRGTAPATDEHRCSVAVAEWREREGGFQLVIEANRFLHHMVRFLVGSMVDTATGRQSLDSFAALLTARDNTGTSAPAPAHALFLDHVSYPAHLYLKSI
ncbi:MAG: tRNA pseudouridine(38-40) synthase TruA [Gemmatimonadaceae bacterium]